MARTNEYKYLGPRKGGSLYRQLFIKDTRIRAEIIYRQVVGAEQMTPDEVAKNWNLPLDVVLECIDYCEKNAGVLQQDRDDEEESLARNRALRPANYPLPPKS